VSENADGTQLQEEAASHLGYLSSLAKDLGVIDPVSAYFEPVLSQWSEISAEAKRWKAAAATIGDASSHLTEPLGRLDAGWEGKNADAFVAYIGRITTADADVKDAFDAMAEALDNLATALRKVVSDMADLLMDAAEVTSESATLSTYSQDRVRSQLQDVCDSAKALFESVRDLLAGFVQLCGTVNDDNVQKQGIEVPHRYPSEKLSLENISPGLSSPTSSSEESGTPAAAQSGETTTPSAADKSDSANLQQGHDTGSVPVEALAGNAAQPQSTQVGDPAQAAPAVGGGMPMGMMPPMGAGQGGGDIQRKSKKRRPAEPEELFGSDEPQVTPPVIGRD
jgi:uncharacterized protein YukE